MCDYRFPDLNEQTLHKWHKLIFTHKLGMWLPWRRHLIPFYIWPLLAIPIRRLISQCPLKYVGNGFSHVARLNAVSMETA